MQLRSRSSRGLRTPHGPCRVARGTGVGQDQQQLLLSNSEQSFIPPCIHPNEAQRVGIVMPAGVLESLECASGLLPTCLMAHCSYRVAGPFIYPRLSGSRNGTQYSSFSLVTVRDEDEVAAKLRVDGAVDHPDLLVEDHRVELGHHLPFPEAAERATFLAARALALGACA